MSFDVDFPSIRAAAERMRSADFECRNLGVDLGDSLETASGAAGGEELTDALGELARTVRTSADTTANVTEELWQAIDESERQYYASDAAASRDIRGVRFGDHDGFR